MGNMSHCRFQNTLADLEECQEHIEDEVLSDDEQDARSRLIQLCIEIAQDYYAELGRA